MSRGSLEHDEAQMHSRQSIIHSFIHSAFGIDTAVPPKTESPVSIRLFDGNVRERFAMVE